MIEERKSVKDITVTISGPNHTGKSTIAKALSDVLEAAGITVERQGFLRLEYPVDQPLPAALDLKNLVGQHVIIDERQAIPRGLASKPFVPTPPSDEKWSDEIPI